MSKRRKAFGCNNNSNGNLSEILCIKVMLWQLFRDKISWIILYNTSYIYLRNPLNQIDFLCFSSGQFHEHVNVTFSLRNNMPVTLVEYIWICFMICLILYLFVYNIGLYWILSYIKHARLVGNTFSLHI